MFRQVFEIFTGPNTCVTILAQKSMQLMSWQLRAHSRLTWGTLWAHSGHTQRAQIVLLRVLTAMTQRDLSNHSEISERTLTSFSELTHAPDLHSQFVITQIPQLFQFRQPSVIHQKTSQFMQLKTTKLAHFR